MSVLDTTTYAVDVTIDGVAIPDAQVVCDVLIRSGRSRQDDGLNPASATVELLEFDPGTVRVEIAAEMVIAIDGVARFTGRIAEVTRTPTAQGGTWTVVGIGHIRRLAAALLALPIAAESAANRAARAISAIGYPSDIRGGLGLQMTAYGQAGDAPASAEAVLGDVVTATGAVVQDAGDGGIMVQFEDARLSEDRWTPDPTVTATDLAFAQTDDVINDVRIGYAGGAASQQDPASISRFDKRSVSLDTSLADVGSAQNRANSIVARLAWPAWAIEQVTTWDRAFFAHEIGALVDLTPLPPGSPVEDPWTGVLEGWVEHYYPAADGSSRVLATFTLAIGDRQHSAEVIHWAGVTPSLTWAGTDPQTAWNEAISNAALTP